MTIYRPYISLKYYDKEFPKNSYVAICFGLTNVEKEITNIGEQADIEFNDSSWFVGAKVNINF